MNPTKSGYADVNGINGINLYHEIYGAGEPLLLILPNPTNRP